MTINISASSELMKNNKQADIMSPQKKFQVLQTREGHALFFSIGTDNIFYLTREVPGSETGWIKTDLSSELSQYHNGIKIVAKDFRVAQNVQTNNIDIILAIQGQDHDYIYTALNLANTDATWAAAMPWAVQAYDDTVHPVPKLVVSDVYIAESSSSEYIVVDTLKDPGNPNNFINRYFLDPSKKVTGQVWNEQALAADLNANEIHSCLGKKSHQLVDGIYTLGAMNGQNELLYTPLYNAFDPTVPPNPSRLQVPQGASAMATAAITPQGTALFVAGDGALYYFAYNKQEDGDGGQVILRNDLFDNVTDLHAHVNNGEIVIWGLNQQGEIFYTRGKAGQETDPSSWTVPIPVLNNVTQIATYLNLSTSGNVIFAHQDETTMVRLSQDPQTTLWDQRNIVLPSTDVNDVLEFNTYTTHIQLEADDYLPSGNQTVEITSTSPVSVYVNNRFAILSPSQPLPVTTDSTGTITILQETESVSAVCYKLRLEGDVNAVEVNPMVKMMETLEAVKTGEDLSKIHVTNADGSTQLLVPDTVTDDHKKAAAQAFQQLVKASKDVPRDGNIIGRAKTRTPVLRTYSASDFIASENTIWGMSFENNNIAYYSGIDAMNYFGLRKNVTTDKFGMSLAAVKLDDIGSAIEATAGDIFNWLKNAWDDVKNFFVSVIDGVYNFFITIGKTLYTFILDCYQTIAHAVEFVFNMIKVFLEDLIKWIGFLFKWDDILRTHNVLKNLMLRNMEHSVSQIDNFKGAVDGFFKDLEERINTLAGLETVGGSLSGQTAAAGPVKGKNDPQSNYGVYHLANGAPQATTNADIKNPVNSQLEQLFKILENAIEKEGDIFEQAFNTFKTQIIDQISTLDIGTIIKRILAVLADIVLESANNIIDAALDVVKIMVEGVIEMLSAPIEIPVLSWLYKEITGNDLSILDVVCLVAAIPGTLMYKIAADKAPFPDDSATAALINAKSWDELVSIFKPKTVLTEERLDVESAQAKEQLTPVEKTLVVTLQFVACISSVASIVTASLRSKNPDNGVISFVNGIVFYTTTAPAIAASLIYNSSQNWYKIMGETVYGLTCIQRLADMGLYKSADKPDGKPNAWKQWGKVSKGLDFVLGLIGLVPSAAPLFYKQDAITITGSASMICWNGNRICTPFTDATPVFVIKMVLIGLYGAGQGAMAIENLVLSDTEKMDSEIAIS